MKIENLKLKIIFFGNTKFSLIGAKIIHDKLGLSQIVTLPDRPDKKGKLNPNPLKSFAIENKIPYLLVDKITDETIEQISNIKPDFLIVEDYGLILPLKLLKLPRYASLNIHHSLLPRYRGTSPAPFAILTGDKITGVSVIAMNEKVDAGDILSQKEYTVKPDETTESLLTELNKLGGEIIIPVIEDYMKGQSQPKKQDEEKATYTQRMSKSDGQIDLDNPPSKEKLDRMIRAYYPWPGVWTKFKVQSSLQSGGQAKFKVLKFLPEQKLQVEGGKPMSIKDFLNGYPMLKPQLEKVLEL